MYDPIVLNKIQLLSYVIEDIKELEEDMKYTEDPSLLLQYREDMRELIAELNEVSSRCIALIEIYLQECKETNEPVCLDFYRVYRELNKARI